MKKFFIPLVLFFISIVVNCGILFRFGSDETHATLGVVLLIISIGLIINPVKTQFKKFEKWKIVLTQIIAVLLMIIIYISASAVILFL